MNEAPKKIWVDGGANVWTAPHPEAKDVLYIRVDIVEEMREALHKLAKLGNGDQYGNSIGNEIARAALKALEEE